MIAAYLRVLETLSLKEDECAAVGWQEKPETGTVTIHSATHEFDIALEDADSTVLHQLTGEWSRWPTVPESLTLVAKLDAAK